MKKFILTLFLVLCSFSHTNAQRFPITVVPQVNPPAPVNFHSYADATTLNSPLRIQLVLSDITVANEQIRLKVYFEGNGINFESRDVVVGASPLFIDGGIPLTLTNTQLAPYFEFQNLQGINPNIYGRTIPEGSYQFCFEIFDFTTGNRLSSKTCASTYIFKNEPPLLNLPLNKVNIESKEVDNIVFQWTPRQINVSNVEYELSIVEIWDDVVDPQTAFLSVPPIFETTTRATSFVYGPAQPLLLAEKRYAWRVRAKALQGAEEIGLFRNEGKSEIFWFSRTSPCATPPTIYAEPKGISKINVFWDEDPTVYQEYTIAYRDANKPNAEWFTIRTNSGWATVWDLKPGTTYEYKVKGKCKYQYSEYSEPQEITTANTQDETANYNCGIVPDEVAITNREPNDNLQVGDRITAGDFVVTITEITGGSDRITGKGYVKVPYLKSARFGVTFKNILINTDNQLAEGEIVTLYDAKFGEGASMTVDVNINISEGITGDQGGFGRIGEVPFVIQSITIDRNGAYAITGTNGESATVSGGRDVQIRDANGTVWSVGDDGTVTKGEVAEGGAVTEDGTQGLTDGEVSQISATGVVIKFKESGKYYFDTLPEGDSDDLKGHYKTLAMAGGESYPIPYKAISDIKGDDFITAEATFSDDSITPGDIVFKTKEGTKVPASWDGNIATLSLKRKSGYLIEQVLATVKPKETDGKYTIAGAFNLVHLGVPKAQGINVVIVPINNAPVNEEDLKEKINEIYNKAGVSFSITVADRLQIPQSVWDIDKNDNELNAGDSGLLSHYSPEEIAINEYFKAKRDYKKETYYIFATDLKAMNSDTKEINGFMPLKRQFGFIFKGATNDAVTAAHELGHGVFGLEHPFTEYNIAEGATNFLMDYSDDTVLNHMDWKKMHAPGFKLYWFQGDEAGEYDRQEYADKVFQIMRCAYLNSEATLDTNIFGKTGDFSASNVDDYGTVIITIKEQPVNIKRTTVQSTIYKSDKHYTLDYGGVVIRAYVAYKYNVGKLEKLQEYLFPEDKLQLEKEIKETLEDINKEGELTSEDFKKIKSIANCGVQYWSAEQRYKIISKIIESKSITEYYEDMILDLLETSPSKDVAENFYKDLIDYLLKDKDLFKELLSDMDDTTDNTPDVFKLGEENNYARFLNVIGSITAKLRDKDRKWDIVNFIIDSKEKFKKLNEREKIAFQIIFESIKEYEGSNESFKSKKYDISVSTRLFMEMLIEDCRVLNSYEIIFRIAMERSLNLEAFASFTQSERKVKEHKGTYLNQIGSISWVLPYSVNHKNGYYQLFNTAKNEYKWPSIAAKEFNNYTYNRDQIFQKILSNGFSAQTFFAKLFQEYKNFLPDYNYRSKLFWKKYKDNPNLIEEEENFTSILKRINLKENAKSLKSIGSIRLKILKKILNDHSIDDEDIDPIYNKISDDALMKVALSYSRGRKSIKEIIEEVGIKKIYNNLSGERLSKFLAWIGWQVIDMKDVIPMEKADIDRLIASAKTGSLASDNKILKLEADMLQFSNAYVTIPDKTHLKIKGNRYLYNQIVPVYVAGDFTFLGETFKKGTLIFMPVIQAFAMSNSNWNSVAEDTVGLTVDVVFLAIGVWELKVIFKVAGASSKIEKVVKIGGVAGGSIDVFETLINENAISQEVRTNMQLLSFLFSASEGIYDVSKLINNTYKAIDDLRNVNDFTKNKLKKYIELNTPDYISGGDILDKINNRLKNSDNISEFKQWIATLSDKDHSTLLQKLDDLGDDILEFAKDYNSVSKANKFIDSPELVDGWGIVKSFRNIRRGEGNIEILTKVSSRFEYWDEGKRYTSFDGLKKLLVDGSPASKQKLLEGFAKVDEIFDTDLPITFSGIKKGDVKVKVDESLFNTGIIDGKGKGDEIARYVDGVLQKKKIIPEADVPKYRVVGSHEGDDILRKGNEVGFRSPDSNQNLNIPAEFTNKAQQLINEVKQIERVVTSDISSIAIANGGVMEGLEYRVKTIESLSRKLFADGINSPMNDVLRYTTTFESKSFTEGVFSVSKSLQDKGYKIVKVKNTFKDGVVYKGININLRAPTGQVFEFQFHTPKSFDIKQNINHSLYEEYRLLDSNSSRAQQLFDEMVRNSNTIPLPNNVPTITLENLKLSIEAGSLVSRLNNNPILSSLEGKINKLGNVLKNQFLDDFAESSDEILQKLQDENLLDVWKNDIRSNNIDELLEYQSKGGLRDKYIQVVKSLESEVNGLLAQGKSKLEIAQLINARRRQITIDYKEATPDDLLEYIFMFNDKRYTNNGWGDKWGQTWEGALKRQKDLKGFDPGDEAYENIIIGAYTPLGTKQQLGNALYKTLGEDVVPVLEKYRMK